MYTPIRFQFQNRTSVESIKVWKKQKTGNDNCSSTFCWVRTMKGNISTTTKSRWSGLDELLAKLRVSFNLSNVLLQLYNIFSKFIFITVKSGLPQSNFLFKSEPNVDVTLEEIVHLWLKLCLWKLGPRSSILSHQEGFGVGNTDIPLLVDSLHLIQEGSQVMPGPEVIVPLALPQGFLPGVQILEPCQLTLFIADQWFDTSLFPSIVIEFKIFNSLCSDSTMSLISGSSDLICRVSSFLLNAFRF